MHVYFDSSSIALYRTSYYRAMLKEGVFMLLKY